MLNITNYHIQLYSHISLYIYKRMFPYSKQDKPIRLLPDMIFPSGARALPRRGRIAFRAGGGGDFSVAIPVFQMIVGQSTINGGWLIVINSDR